jgi:hypothetical protein
MQEHKKANPLCRRHAAEHMVYYLKKFLVFNWVTADCEIVKLNSCANKLNFMNFVNNLQKRNSDSELKQGKNKLITQYHAQEN